MRDAILPYYALGITIKFFLDILGPIFEVYIDSTLKKQVLEFKKSIFLKSFENKFAIRFVGWHDF